MSNVRKRNRRTARKLAERLVAVRDPMEAAFVAAMIACGGAPMKPLKWSRGGKTWTYRAPHADRTPDIPVGLVVKLAERFRARSTRKDHVDQNS